MKRGLLLIGFIILILFMSVFVSALPDLIISKLEKIDYQSYQFGTLWFCSKNLGNQNSINVPISSSYDTLSIKSGILESGAEEPLSPGKEHCGYWLAFLGTNLTFMEFLASESDIITFRFVIDPENIMEESNESNNVKEISYTGAEFKEFNEKIELLEEERAEQIRQRRENIPLFLIAEDVGDLIFDNDDADVIELVNYVDCGVLTQEGSLEYIGYYLTSDGDRAVRISVIVLPNELENRAVLEDSIKCYFESGESRNINFKIQNFEGNEYLYAEVPEYSSSRGEYKSDYHVWYNGNKIITVMYEKVYSNQGEELLSAYFDKYPSKLSAPAGLIQAIINFFKKLFGIQ